MPQIKIDFLDFYTGAIVPDGVIVDVYAIDVNNPYVVNPSLFIEEEIIGAGTAMPGIGQAIFNNLQLLTEYAVTFTGTAAPSSTSFIYTKYLNQAGVGDVEAVQVFELEVLVGYAGPQGPQGLQGVNSVETFTFTGTVPASGNTFTIPTSGFSSSGFPLNSYVYVSDGTNDFYGQVTAIGNPLVLSVMEVLAGTPGDVFGPDCSIALAGPPGQQGTTGPQGLQGIAGISYLSGFSNTYRDMLLWTGWIPGTITTGGTVIGANPNPPQSPAGLLSLNTTTGALTITIPALPTGFTGGWALRLDATMEGISPNAIPAGFSPIYFSLSTFGETVTAYFEDADWGNFIGFSGMSTTASTRLNGAYSGDGVIIINCYTNGVSATNQYGTPLNLKIHFLLDLVAY